MNTLAESMKTESLLQPVVVRYADGERGGQPLLVAGRHRVEAAKKLKWSSIDARIVTMDSMRAEIAEIDENLKRGELSPAQACQHHAKRQELHLQLHPETSVGKAPGAGRGRGKAKPLEDDHNDHLPKSYAEETAEKTDQSAVHVRRQVRIGKTIPDTEFEAVIGTHLDKVTELDAITKLEPEHRDQLFADLEAGKPTKATTLLGKQKRNQRAKIYIYQNQLERRNLTEDQLNKAIVDYYELIRIVDKSEHARIAAQARHDAGDRDGHEQSEDPKPRARDRTAETFGVSPRKVQIAVAKDKAVKAVAEVDPEAAETFKPIAATSPLFTFA